MGFLTASMFRRLVSHSGASAVLIFFLVSLCSLWAGSIIVIGTPPPTGKTAVKELPFIIPAGGAQIRVEASELVTGSYAQFARIVSVGNLSNVEVLLDGQAVRITTDVPCEIPIQVA